MIKISNILILIFCLFASLIIANSQELPKKVNDPIDSLRVKSKLDSINRVVAEINRNKSNGLDTIVTYQANDTITFNVKSQTMRLRGNSKVFFKNQKLEAEIIEISFKNSMLEAEGATDTNKKVYGYPKFIDRGEEFAGERIKFNFKTNQGAISLGETKMGEGYYFGTQIKRVSDVELFVKDGYYTTCDNPQPHYHFGSPRMKVIAQDRVFMDPILMYVEDLPVFILPFGLYFPSKGGKQSGLIVPTFSFSSSQGVVFQNLGYYWAASDYWDTQIKTDIYSKGGIMLKSQTTYKIIDNLNGNLNLEYGKTRRTVDDDYNTNFRLNFYHNQLISPDESFVANLNFSSSNFNRNTISNQRDFQQQSIYSSASYNKSFSNRSNLSLSYTRNQNIITDETNQSIPLSYSFPTTKLFNGLTDAPTWIRDIQFSYGFSAAYTDQVSRLIQKRFPKDTANKEIDTSFNKSTSQKIQHSPSLSISPKLGFFTISPSISFGANNYFRSIHKTFNPSDTTIRIDTTDGFYTEYRYSIGVSLSTNIYGIADDSRPLFFLIKPSSLGFKAFRHSYSPSVSLSFIPDQSDEKFGFYGSYLNEYKQKVLYSRFEADGGGIASSRLGNQLNYSDRHSFEIKVAQGDTIPDKNIELLRLEFNTGFNFAADSFKLSDINLSFRTPAITFVEFSGRASFTPYNETYDRITGQDGIQTNVYRKLNSYLFETGKALVRMTSFSINLSTSLNSEGITINPAGIDNPKKGKDTMSVGDRFLKRHEGNQNPIDLFGDNLPGYTDITMPWNLTLNLMYNYYRPSIDPTSKSETLSLNLSSRFQLTQTWAMTVAGNYDFINKQLGVPQINFTKDMHCWDFSFNWLPSGGNSGFYLRFGIKASQLQDLKIEKQDSPYLR